MTTAPTTYDDRTTAALTRPGLLKRVVTGAAAFDAALGVACLAAAGAFGSWLSIPVTAVRATGAVFLLAAVTGAWTASRDAAQARPIIAANTVFSLWCVLLLAADSPNASGAVILVISALAGAVTATVEHRLSRA